MSTQIHPSSVLHPRAQLGADVEIGPFCDVGPDVVLRDRVRLHSRVSLTGTTDVGEDSELFPGVALGGRAQSLGSKDNRENRLIVGPRCTLRESFSAHVGSTEHGQETRIGADCYFMAFTHVAHDCVIGDKCVAANGANIGGHCVLGDQVWFGGLAVVHQFTHIGDHAFIGGGAIVVGDVLPFMTVAGNRARMSGVNVNGLKRRGFSRADMKDIRSTIKALYAEEGSFSDRLSALRETVEPGSPSSKIVEFVDRPSRTRPLCFPE